MTEAPLPDEYHQGIARAYTGRLRDAFPQCLIERAEINFGMYDLNDPIESTKNTSPNTLFGTFISNVIFAGGAVFGMAYRLRHPIETLRNMRNSWF